MAFASIAVLFACLLLLGSAVMIVANIDAAFGWLEGQNIAMVYIEKDTARDDVEAVERTIKSYDTIASCKFISKEEALEKQKANLGDYADILESLEKDNPLSDSFQVSVKDLSQYDQTVERLKAIPFVEKVTDRSADARTMLNIRNLVSMGGFWIIAVLIIVALFIVANTIRITMYVRRLEISIMKSVGATNGFIVFPFVVQGVILGIISGLLSFGSLWYVYGLVARGVAEMMDLLTPLPFSAAAGMILAIFLAVGILTGSLGSAISIRRHLKDGGGGIYDAL